MKKTIIGTFVILFCAIQFSFGQGHHDQTSPFTLKKLTDHVYALYGKGGNIGFFVGPDAVCVVDSQYMELAPGIVDQIKSVTDKPIKYLLNTHHHPDHVGGNGYFIKFAIIIAHDNVRKHMLLSPQEILRDYPKELEEAKKKGRRDQVKFIEEQIEWAKKVKVEEIPAPFMTFDSEFRIYMGDETIDVWHTPPAHTDGDSVVYFEKAKVLHMGDVFFHKIIPFIDVEAGGSVPGYVSAIDKVLGRVPADVTIIPGHGQVTDVAGLKEFRQYMLDLSDLAQKAKASGMSHDDFVSKSDLAAYKTWDGYADRFKDDLDAAYKTAQ